MRDVSRHKSMDVLQAYVRDADMFRDHAVWGCCSGPLLGQRQPLLHCPAAAGLDIVKRP